MLRKLLFLVFLSLVLFQGYVCAQIKPVFSGDPEKFRQELTAFMGSSLTAENSSILNAFLTRWDSTGFSISNRSRIIEISNKLVSRQMRAVPHFIRLGQTLSILSDYERNKELITSWLTGFSEMVVRSDLSNDILLGYIINTGSLISNNLLTGSRSVTWKIRNAQPVFTYDTLFKAVLKGATLTCFSQQDSTEIYNVSGTFLPALQQFRGSGGTVTWEKAGYSKVDVFAELQDFTLNTTRSSFTCDSAKLVHRAYFKEPVYGVLNDQATSITSQEKSIYPQFETYTRNFRINDFYTDVDYEGGLAFEGATVKGRGEMFYPARVIFFRNDSQFIKIASIEFVFTATGLTGQETAATIYLRKDSVFHTNLGFSYNAKNRQVNLFRTNNPVSESPYYNTFHNLDMYFESLSWDMNSSRILISRPRGAAMGEALFESVSFFNSDYFLNLMNLDDYHPLTRLKQFAEWYYSETFPVSEFAKWLDKSEDVVTGLCIDMANRGFVFFDRAAQEVTLKKKINDFIDSYAGKKDYDILSIYSETKAPVDNAILDLNTYDLTVNGVTNVFLSDSQKVAIYPYNQKLTIRKNRSITFDGVVQAGLFTVFGHNFQFSYDTFMIKLQKIDSIRVAMETEKTDAFGKPIIRELNSLIQLSTGELFIDDPENKSGLKGLTEFPIINATAPSYIFYDRIPGLEGVYLQKDFYFKIDPFTMENLDHYAQKDFNLEGEFYAGKILEPRRQFLTIQENNSLGFQMSIPDEGIRVYDGKGVFYDQIRMSNRGLTGIGTLRHLTSTTRSDDFRFYPDSMLTQAVAFNIENDGSGYYPELKGEDVRIKWMPWKEEWLAYNTGNKNFDMFGNGTMLDGNLKLSPSRLNGTGIINTPDSRINSNLFTFTSNAIRADTADFNLKSPSTSGYAFIAENANTDVNFDNKISRFHLNTDSSMVKFPEIQYICTMTDFEYNMSTRILSMEQRGKTTSSTLLPPEKLRRVTKNDISKPTFFATGSLSDTIAFTSLKARYNVDQEYIEAENISYIPVADALIQPENGKITINRRARIDKLKNALIAVNNRHLIHSADVDIESTRKYSGSGVYDYVDETGDARQISLPEITVDTLTTSAKGFIAADQNFMLSPAFTFTGDVNLSARSDYLLFTGAAGIVHDCIPVKSSPVKFRSFIDPKNVMIPISEKPRDINDNLVFSGSYLNIDSVNVYPAFLSQQRSWTDVGLVNATGMLYFNKAKGQYQISSIEKIANPAMNGNMVTFDRNFCTIAGEGSLNFGTDFDLVRIASSGNFIQTTDSGKINIKAILAFDFFFSEDALKLMSDDIRMMPSLKPVNLNSEFINKGMRDLLGSSTAERLKEETDLFGLSDNLPKEFNFEIVLNEVNLTWNENSSSFRSTGKIGIGYIGNQPVNIYTDGFIEIQRRRSGDLMDIYIKADESTWFYFSYFKGVMMAQSGNMNFNTLLANLKLKDRKHPDSSVRTPYTYMIAVEDRLNRFLRRMTEGPDISGSQFDNLVR